jgi:hypothetical protein
MALTQQQLRMMATLLAKKKQANALAQPPASNWLNKPLPMEGRFGLLPIKESQPGMGPSVFNKRELALPGLLAGAVNAFTAPGRAASGQPGFKPEEETAGRLGTTSRVVARSTLTMFTASTGLAITATSVTATRWTGRHSRLLTR